jgi:hypothetical protein
LQGILSNAGGVGSRPGVVNPNIQQPYYTAHAYGPGAPQLVPNACFPKPPIFPAVTSNTATGKSDNVRD